MSEAILIAVIAAFPPTIAAVLAFFGTRSVKRSLGPTNGGIPLSHIVEGLGAKVDRLAEEQSGIKERLARLEVGIFGGGGS